MAEPATLEELKGLLPEAKSVAPEETPTPISPVQPEPTAPLIPETASPVSPVPESPVSPIPESEPTPVPSYVPDPSPSAQISLEELQSFLPERTLTEQATDKAGELAEDAGKRIYERIAGTDVSDPKEIERLVTTLWGSVVGAQAGSRVPGPPIVKGIGTLVGAGIGVAAGTVIPEAFFNFLETTGIMPPGSASKVSLSMEELQTVLMGEVLLEVATQGGAGLLRMGGRLTGQVFTGIGKEGRRIAEESARLGINLMPVQVGDRVLGKGFVAVMGKFPLVGRPFYNTGTKVEKAFAAQVRAMPELIAPLMSQSDLGVKMYGEAKALLKGTNDFFKERYERIWAAAEKAGVGVKPKHTLSEAEKIKAEMFERTPTGVDEALGTKDKGKNLDAIYKKYLKFLDKHIFKMEKSTPGEEISYIRREQTLREMDGLASQVDRFAKTLEPGQVRIIQAFNARIKTAILLDMETNAFGPGANFIIGEMRALDKKFTTTMAQYFETATAKKFGKVRKRGLRAIEFDEATMTNIDELAKSIINLNSPESIKELRRIVTPSTFRTIKANILYDALRIPTREAGTEGHIVFDAHKFQENIGFDNVIASKKQTYEELFKNGNVTVKDLQNFLDVGKKISGLEIPNVSSFIARRAVLGGRAGIWTAFMVGSAGGAASGYDSGGFLGLAANTIMFAGGMRLLSATLANPLTARAFLRVADKELSIAQRRAAIARVIRLGLVGTGYGAEELQGKVGEAYDKTYPGEGNISEPINRMLLPQPGLNEEQKQSGTKRLQENAIKEVLHFTDAYVSLGLGQTPLEPTDPNFLEYSPNPPKAIFHKGGLIKQDIPTLASNLEKIPDLQRDKHLRNLHAKKRETFDQLMEYLESR